MSSENKRPPEKEYYWLKLHDDFFSSKRIKKLRNMAGGDTYIIIYLKMQLLAIKTDGLLTWTGLEDSFADELALDLDEKPDDVEVTLLYLLKTGLAETSDNINFFFPYAVLNTGSETSAAKRMRAMRERNNLAERNNVTQMLRDCYGEKEIELESELELEKEDLPISDDIGRVPDFLQMAVDAWNSLGLNHVKSVTEGTQRYQMLSKRIKDYGIDEVVRVIESVKDSSFLMGRKKDWKATFDWIICPNNFVKVRDGNFLDAPNKVYDHEGIPYKAAKKMSRMIRKRLPSIPEHDENTLQRWAAELEACCEEYNTTFDDLADVMNLSQTDPFWRNNILDAHALRRNYLKLLAKAQGGEQD